MTTHALIAEAKAVEALAALTALSLFSGPVGLDLPQLTIHIPSCLPRVYPWMPDAQQELSKTFLE